MMITGTMVAPADGRSQMPINAANEKTKIMRASYFKDYHPFMRTISFNSNTGVVPQLTPRTETL